MREVWSFKRLGWGIWVLTATMIILTPSIAPTAEKVQFATDWVITGKVAPFFMGLAKGFYKEQDLDVTINRGFGSARGVNDLVSGTIDYGFVDCIAGIVGKSRGHPLKYVSIVFDKGPYIVISLSNSGIKAPTDLKGKKLGAALEETGRYVVTALLRAHGMEPQDITWVTTTPAGKNPALLVGQVDAVPHFSTGLPPLLLQAKKNNQTLNILYASDWGVDIYSLGIMTHEKRVNEKQDQVRRFVQASMKAWAWSIEHPEEMLTLFRPYALEVEPELARQEFLEALKLVVTDFTKKHGIGMVDSTKMLKTVDFATTYLKLEKKVRAEDLYTNEFLPRLLPK